VTIPAMAITTMGARQENQVKRNTVSRGPKTRLNGGAVCWTARALPQSWRLTRAVMVATFDGRFMPAIRPSISTAPRKAHNWVSIVHSRRAQAVPIRDRAMVPLC
jgi:hypothetical protein